MSSPDPSPIHLRASLLGALLLPLLACEPAPPPDYPEGRGEGGAEWLSGTVDQRFQQVGEQMAGFSATMFEVAHRYRELYWAIEDSNWAYADYQVEKIADAVERGIIRRPGRATSAESLFLGDPVSDLRAALETGEEGPIRERFGQLTAACNQCHVAEAMEFVVIGPPAERSTVVQPEGPRP